MHASSGLSISNSVFFFLCWPFKYELFCKIILFPSDGVLMIIFSVTLVIAPQKFIWSENKFIGEIDVNCLCLTSEIAEHHRRCSPSWKHTAWGRGGRRNLYHHWDHDNKSWEGQNDSAVQISTNSRKKALLMTDVFLFSSCWVLMTLPWGRHSLTRNSLPKGRRWQSFCPCSTCLRLPAVYCGFFSILCFAFITDGQPAQFWAGNVCAWCPGQGCVWSDVHLAGGEDQPVAGSEGAVAALITPQKTVVDRPSSCCYRCRCVLPSITWCVFYMLCRMKSTTAVRPPQL